MSAVDVIQRLAATSSRSEKEQIIFDAFMTGEREFFLGAQLAYDILVTFGVKKVAEITDEEEFVGDYTWDEFLDLAGKLRRRELTGNAAKDAIHSAAERCTTSVWNGFYRRILLKDLKCGVEDSTINKVLNKLVPSNPEAKSFIIPIFTCQLAHDGMKPEHQKKIKGRKLLDVKLDGVRLLTILDKEHDTVVQYTRNGKVNDNFPHITAGLKSLMQTLPGSMVIDGEITAASFQELMTQVNRKEKVDTSTAKLAIFDIVPLSAFRAGVCDIPQEMRHIILSQMDSSGAFRQHCGEAVYVIPKVTVDLDTPEGQSAFAEFNKQAVAAGYEGIMVKDPDAPYELKRSVAWLKIKPFIEVSLTIVGYQEGEAGSKYEGMLGAWLMEGEDDGRQIAVHVGGGLTDKERADYWARRDEMIGFIGEVRADAMSKERNSDVWSLRFPRWKGLRGTQPGEKL